jgi:iron complex outermembrane receptor protein
MPRFVLVRLLAALALLALSATGAAQTEPDLTTLSLEELANTQVTVVSKRAESRDKVPAAVAVVTPEDIRASGITTIAEAIRNVPGVHVARLNSNAWAIGVRGFTSQLNRSQLVLIDGRSVYNPLFAGTYWDVQDTLLEDVERIEVVRGPGGTLWGANAVNGILNVVTKEASETQGGFITLGGGNEQRAFARARHGGAIGTKGHYRVYGKFADRDGGFVPTGEAFDDSRITQGGFRTDWRLSELTHLTVQGDIYSAEAGQRTSFASYQAPFGRIAEEDATMSGANLLGRWRRSFTNAAAVELQVYYDRTVRDEATFGERRETFDADLQYAFPALSRHQLIAGAGYRLSDGRTSGIETVVFDPPEVTDHLVSVFVQDEIAVIPERVALTIGTKVEHNDYSGVEFQPGLRLAWFGSRSTVWAAATRAVRTPSRFDRDLVFTVSFDPARPIFLRAIGNDGFDSERVDSYELGYRVRATSRLSIDVAGFHNRYPNLFSLEQGAPFVEGTRFVAPFIVDNLLTGRAAGGELAVESAITDRWLIKGAYSYLDFELRNRADSRDLSSANAERNSPRHMVQLQSSTAIGSAFDAQIRARWVDELPSQSIDAYATLDARLAWRATPRVGFALNGQNLLDAEHGEFGGTNAGFTKIERSIFGEVTWRW